MQQPPNNTQQPTDTTQPQANTAQPMPTGTPGQPAAKPKKRGCLIAAIVAAALFVIIVIAALASSGGPSSGSPAATDGDGAAQAEQAEGTPQGEAVEDTPQEEAPAAAEGGTGFGDTLDLDGFEVVFHDDIGSDTVDNQFDDDHGAEVIRLPMTVTNATGETQTPWVSMSIQVYGPDGLECRTFDAYFDDAPMQVDNMRDGSTQDIAIYALYNGPGEYCIEASAFFGRETYEIYFTLE